MLSKSWFMNQAMSLVPFLVAILAVTATAQKPSSTWFISIDCGLDSAFSYKDTDNGLEYSPDNPYTTTGVNRRVSPETNLSSIREYYATVRSFPDGTRNCYTLGPLLPGAKYRVKAEFLYGNYDGLRRSPIFDLYLGVNFWQTMDTGDFNRAEIISVANGSNIQVCLVNTGRGTPFISELILRPLSSYMYETVNDSSSSFVANSVRRNFGYGYQISYPDDIYDRLWSPISLGKSISTSQTVSTLNEATVPVPQTVLRTASEALFLTDTFEISDYGSEDQRIFVYMYFAEVQRLAINETREFSAYAGSTPYFTSFRPRFLQQDVFATNPPGIPGGRTYVIRATSNATLPPIINAIEIFRLQKMPILPTNQRDVSAIMALRNTSGRGRYWEGDPCVPRQLIWTGLDCGYDSLNYSTITSLDLSRSGLTGGIPLSIANLTSLTSLDLSFNNITGQIPEYLGSLGSLKSLNLESNNLIGPVPITLYQRSKNGSLELRINNNPNICSATDLCTSSSTKKKSVVIPIAITVSVTFVIILAVVATFCIFKRRKIERPSSTQVVTNSGQQTGNSTPRFLSTEGRLHSESNQFSEADILKITSNLNRPIGQGGFGTVYYGTLDDGTEVAVKLLSKLTGQGEKQFRTEAELLTRVHHRNLVSLLGYCKENMALVYEYLPQGSLADHLSGGSAKTNFLGWSLRLRIALGAAQGLDYLHNGCTPPIIHRDVKPSNFLLTENFEVKIADFGLSRSFGEGISTYKSTVVAGTPGYLDPECQQTNSFSESSDVYSFGVVLLQLVTGKPPLSHGRTVMHITKEVKAIMERGDVHNIADPRMNGNFDVNSVWRVIEIGLSCASFSSTERPTMSDVASQLKDCLALETSKEYSTNVGSGIFDMYPSHSEVSVRPAAR